MAEEFTSRRLRAPGLIVYVPGGWSDPGARR